MHGVLPTTQFAYCKCMGTWDALLCVSHRLQSALESGQESRIMQIDFSSVCVRVNHQGILYKLCSVCTGGSVFSVLTKFLLNVSQHVLVDGCRSKLVNVVSGLQQGSVLGPLLFLLRISKLFSILENKLIGYADDSTSICSCAIPILLSYSGRVLNRGLGKVSEWCNLCAMN